MALNFRSFLNGIRIFPKAASTVSAQGDMDVDTTSGRINYHDGTNSSLIVSDISTDQGANRLKNKDLDDATTAVVDTSDTTKKIKFDAAGTTNTSTTLTSSQTANRVLTLPDVTGTLTTDAGTGTISNKTIDNTNTITVKDANFTIQDDGDTTKQAKFQASGITTATTRTFTLPDANTTLVGTDATQTLTNKTLSGNTASNLVNSSGTFNFNSTGTITAPNATDTLVGKATTDVLTNKTLTAPVIATIVNTGTLTLPTSTDTLVGRATTDTLSNKTFSDAITGAQISTPSNPSSGFDKVYFKSDDNLYSLTSAGTEKLIGSTSAGSPAPNFVGLTTTWVPSNTNDVNAEATVGNWTTYKSGTTVPTTLTGGSATHLTLSRTTTAGEVLDGVASFKVVKTANNAQGEGTSCVFNVPPAYQGKTVTIKIPYRLVTGSLLSGDLQVFIEDVTNSTIITPFNNDLINGIGGSGLILATFTTTAPAATPANLQMRVGMHFASTSATAVTITWDDVFIGTENTPLGMAGSDWRSDTNLTASASFGTITGSTFESRRIGDSLECLISFTSGTTTSSAAAINLGTYAIDSIKISTGGFQIVGEFIETVTTNAYSATNGTAGYMFFDGSDTANVYLTITSTSGSMTKLAANNNGSTRPFSFKFIVPIAGWSSNISVGQSSTFSISSFLANGTRVTGSAPTALGQYRSYLRNAGAQTYTETNGSPTTAPTVTNGVQLYNNSGAFSSGDSNNQPSRYEIFVGKNKTVRPVYYLNSGRTGFIDITPGQQSSSQSMGYATNYDQTSGIFSIVPFYSSGTETGHYSGLGNLASGTNNNPFFDIVISENALVVGTQNPRSEIKYTTPTASNSGFGSTNTFVRYFTVLTSNVGTAFTDLSSAANGTKIQINEDGVYDMSWESDYANGTAQRSIYFAINPVGLTSDQSATSAARAATVQTSALSNSFTNAPGPSISYATILHAGDLVYPMVDGVSSATWSIVATTKFHIVKVSN